VGWRPDGDFWRLFWVPAFAASRVQHVSDLYSKFTLGSHHVSKYGRHPTCVILPRISCLCLRSFWYRLQPVQHYGLCSCMCVRVSGSNKGACNHTKEIGDGPRQRQHNSGTSVKSLVIVPHPQTGHIDNVLIADCRPVKYPLQQRSRRIKTTRWGKGIYD